MTWAAGRSYDAPYDAYPELPTLQVPTMAASAPAPLSEVEKSLRLSADPRSLNLTQVGARARALHGKIDEAHRRLAATPPVSVSWPDVVSQFGVMSAQLSALSAELRPLCKHYALHPSARGLANATPWWREAALPNMHSVRLEPAMEAEEREALERHARASGGGAHPAAFELDALQQAVEAHNGVCGAAAARVLERRKELFGAAAAAAAPPPPAKVQPTPGDAARLLAVATTGEGLRRART